MSATQQSTRQRKQRDKNAAARDMHDLAAPDVVWRPVHHGILHEGLNKSQYEMRHGVDVPVEDSEVEKKHFSRKTQCVKEDLQIATTKTSAVYLDCGLSQKDKHKLQCIIVARNGHRQICNMQRFVDFKHRLHNSSTLLTLCFCHGTDK